MLITIRKKIWVKKSIFIKLWKIQMNRFNNKNTVLELSGKQVHILATKRKDYVKSAIYCANSILAYSPDLTIMIHTDEMNLEVFNSKFQKFVKKRQVRFNVLSGEMTWQRQKMHLILNEMNSNDLFSDSDIFWNGRLPECKKALIFVEELEKFEKDPYATLSNFCGWDEEISMRMYNTSVVSLGSNINKLEFKLDAEQAWDRIASVLSMNDFPEIWKPKILRLIEQISISYAFSKLKKEEFELLKDQDSPMDGSIAESYYLGTIFNWD